MKDFSNNRLYVDRLTGLHNFFKLIEANTEFIFGSEGTILILDLINFSNINDRYGSNVGDLCLQKFANILQEETAKFDKASIFRLGGDEFIIILNQVGLPEAQELFKTIEDIYQETLTSIDIKNNGLHNLIYNYSEPLGITEFLKIVGKTTWTTKFDDGDRQKNWSDQIITSLVNRIKETISLFNDAYELALTDDISKLPNHRSARLYLENLLDDQDDEPIFSLLFIDGDNLKRYNNISYQAGNDMIENLSKLIQNSLRQDDKVFRWLSGDEFIVVLDKLDSNTVDKLAERIRSNVEEETKMWEYPVTISLGVARYPTDSDKIEELIKKAEEANFQAKKEGKNRVIRYDQLS